MAENPPFKDDDLTGEDRELLDYLLSQEQQASPTRDRIRPRDDSTPPPLSFGQQRLWVIDQIADDRSAYTITLCLRALGPLDRDALAESLTEITRRHETLRTSFTAEDGKPIQRIAESTQIKLPLHVNSSGVATSVEVACEEVISEALAEPFDLARGPLIMARLLEVAPDDHVIILLMHHIVSDAWSNRILLDELLELYSAHCEDRAPSLPALPIQYADYATWQRAWAKSEDFERQLSYWKDKLAGAPAVLELPSDKPRAAVQSFAGAQERRVLPSDLSEAVQALSRREGATLFMTLLAVFTVLLHRYCAGEEDIVIGTPIAGRHRAEIEGLIGFFVNSLALRTDLSGDPTFRELLSRVRETALDAYQYQELPFEKMVEELAPTRDLSRTPLFQVMFALQNAPTATLEQSHLELSVLSLPLSTVRFDLEVHIWKLPEGLSVSFIYNIDLFERATVERMLTHYERLLRAVVADPDCPISRISMLSEDELDRLLRVWAGATSDSPREATIPSLFEGVVAERPQSTAVIFGKQELSYSELNEQANRLAHYLKGLGVGPEAPVGLCLERGSDLVVAVLAILKAGGAYVPLDPEYPRERLGHMLDDSGLTILVTRSELRQALPPFGGRVISLDRDRRAIDRESGDNPPVQVTASNLAYVIYTSGSTGRPKGTRIEHRSVVRLVKETNYVELGPDEVVLQFAPISFDASTFELWGSLLNGATLAIMAPGVSSLEALAAALREHRVTTLWLTAALFHQMVDSQLSALQGVRQILAGGEALSVAHVKRMLAALPATHRLLNGYGPTENTTFTTCHVMTAESEIGRSVPIGRPIANTRIYILDRRRHPVPIGACGELYIGGDGLARDYLNQPELTQEKFVQDPFSQDAGARLYRTGDMVRFLADGAIEFLGRVDHQVKLRGYRIELGEIEAVLGRCPGVRRALVLLREDQLGNRRLIAYMVPDEEQAPRLREVREFLRMQLPAHMVPAAFVQLETLPLTLNGKIDRNALPAPDQHHDFARLPYAAPDTEIQRTLVTQWRDLLGVERIGLHDNFFDLGGHSLIATQAISRLRSELETEITMAEFFQHPSVSALAELIENSRWARSERGRPQDDAGADAFEEGEL